MTTLDEVIRHHAGEARKQRLAYENLVAEKRAAVIEFLKTMQTPAADLPDPTYHQLAESLAAKVGGVAVDSRGGVYGQFVERAEAAAIRAERTTAHIRSQARRIEYELERAELGVDRNAQTVSLLPAKPSPTSHRIAETLVSFNSDENIQRILSSLARAESAMIDAFEVVKPALIRAARAGASEQPARVGHIQAEAMISNLNDLNQHREFEKILIELVAWCDDVAFRTEQIGQQTDLAEMRVEAFASYHQQNSRQIANPIRNDLQENSPR